MAAAGLSPLPAGIGVLDCALVLALTAAGATTPLALAAVLLYRVVSQGHVLLLGWSAVAARSTRPLPFAAVRGSIAGGPAITDAADAAPRTCERTCRRRRIPRWKLRKGCNTRVAADVVAQF